MLRSLKTQRRKLQQKIEEQISAGKGLLDRSSASDLCEELGSQADSSILNLTKTQVRYTSVFEKICEASEDRPDEEIDAESEQMVELMCDVDEITSRLTELQNRINKHLVIRKTEGATGSNSTFNGSFQEATGQQSVRLPKLEFDKFSGDILKFQEFWDSFNAAVHSNASLRSVEKLNYLRAYLIGEAKHSISGISTCDANYEVAVEILKGRFGNTQASIDAHYMKLMNIRPVPNDSGRLRNLFDHIEQHLRCLAALGEDINHRHFISLIMSKLPQEVIIRLEEFRSHEEEWTVDLLRNKLSNLLQAQEAAQRQRVSSRAFEDKSSAGPSFNRGSRHINSSSDGKFRHPSTMGSMVAAERPSVKYQQKACILCGDSHFNDECPRYKTAADRRQRIKGRCFICLSKEHKAQQCKSMKVCFHCKRRQIHNRMLCPVRFPESGNISAVTSENVEEDPVVTDKHRNTGASDHSLLATGDRVLLQTATVFVSNPKNNCSVKTRVLLDCASNRTYITASLASKLQLQALSQESFSVVTFGSYKPKTVTTSTAQIQLRLKDKTTKLFDVNVVPRITGDIKRAPVPFDKSSFLWKDLPLADSLPTESESSSVDFLIGNDYYLELITGQKIEISRGLYLLGSELGWLLTGRLENQRDSESGITMFVSSLMNSSLPAVSTNSPLDLSLPVKPSFDDFWKLESIGIMDEAEVKDDDRALFQFNSTVKFHGGRYEVTWPWKESAPDLPDNYQLSMGRFQSLMKKLRSNSDLHKKYSDIITDQEAKGVIEKVPTSSMKNVQHYIPHHPVVKPGKVRIVYDASAKVRKSAKSLNECLLRGPVILEDLVGLLLRFRQHPVAICADIEKAFLQIGLQTADRDVTRFFWLKDPCRSDVASNLQVYRFCRVPFGMISSPFLLSATVKHHLQQYNSAVAKQIRENIYVDNVVTGMQTTEHAVQFYKEAKKIFSQASMNLRQWTSNSDTFVRQLVSDDAIVEDTIKVLGLIWNRKDDVLHITSQPSQKFLLAATKRQLLQSMASTFDPMGLFAPITIKAKILMRELWETKSDWDDEISATAKKRWQSIANECIQITKVGIARFVGLNDPKGVGSIELHCFTDASAIAYSAAVYVKTLDGSSSSVNLIFVKTRLAPSRKTSIPRLELLGVLIGVRAINFVQRQLRLPFVEKVLWSDSQCVLHWLSSKKDLAVFVRNRLNEIQKTADISFRYVGTNDNPADLATRGEATCESLNSSYWWHGPSWLDKEKSEWPVWQCDIPASYYGNADRLEEKYDQHSDASLVSVKPSELSDQFPIEICPTNYSSTIRLLRVTAWILRAIEAFKGKKCSFYGLTSAEIRIAKKLWDKAVQKMYFPKIYNALKEKTKCNLKEHFNVHADKEGILRCYGRFLNADLPEDAKYPKLIPRRCHYTSLIINQFHQKLMHAGVSHTLSQIRHEYWIPQGRAAVKDSIRQCLICRKYHGGPYRAPLMPQLPTSRVTPSSPFTYTGLDYMGPLNVKVTGSDVRKIWVCLFTCLSVRAVHLELVLDCSAEQFLLCLRRFVARRGKPKEIISDNATQFKLSQSVLDKAWGQALSSDDVHTYISSEGISWKFITERAPWMGGLYERLIGSVKIALKKAIGRLLLPLDKMLTVLAEIEAVINTRPLCYVDSSDISTRVISPQDFLSLNPKTGFFVNRSEDASGDDEFNPKADAADKLIATWKKGHKILDGFWNMWKDNYLSGLRERSDFCHKQPRVVSGLSPSIDDVVLIKEDHLPRGSWKIGRITQLYPGQDGKVRSVQLILPSRTLINRPVKSLYPIECSERERVANHQPESSPPSSSNPVPNLLVPAHSNDPNVFRVPANPNGIDPVAAADGRNTSSAMERQPTSLIAGRNSSSLSNGLDDSKRSSSSPDMDSALNDVADDSSTIPNSNHISSPQVKVNKSSALSHPPASTGSLLNRKQRKDAVHAKETLRQLAESNGI